MNTETQMIELVKRFQEVLDSRRDILECFCNYGVQLEGWLKGELLYFLDTEKTVGHLHDFDREVSFGHGRRKVDITITDGNGWVSWVELKHWLIGFQRGYKYDAGFYLRDSSSVGIKLDVEKLKLAHGSKYVLTLATGNPGVDGWFGGVEQFNSKFAPLHLSPLTDPKVFPPQYFLGLLSAE